MLAVGPVLLARRDGQKYERTGLMRAMSVCLP